MDQDTRDEHFPEPVRTPEALDGQPTVGERTRERCPECRSARIGYEVETDDDGNITDRYCTCEECLHAWSYAHMKAEETGGQPPIEAVRQAAEESKPLPEWQITPGKKLPAFSTPPTASLPLCGGHSLDITQLGRGWHIGVVIGRFHSGTFEEAVQATPGLLAAQCEAVAAQLRAKERQTA